MVSLMLKCSNIGDITRGKSEYIISSNRSVTIDIVCSHVVVTFLLFNFFVTLGVNCRVLIRLFPFTIKSIMDYCFGVDLTVGPLLGVLGGPCVDAVILLNSLLLYLLLWEHSFPISRGTSGFRLWD